MDEKSKTATINVQPLGSYQSDLGGGVPVQPPNFRGEKPPSYFPLSIFTCLGTCNCPFGILAIILSTLSDKAWDNGDRNSAKMKGTIAFFLGLIGSLLALIVALIVIIVYVVAPTTTNVAILLIALLVFANISLHFLHYGMKCESIRDLVNVNKFLLKN